MLISPFLTILSLSLPILIHAEDLEECERELQYELKSDGDVCCPMWKAANCRISGVKNEDPLSRALALTAQKSLLQKSGCSKFANNVGGGMPVSCYWRYRKWVIMITGVVGAMALLVVIAVLIAHKRRRRGSSMTQPLNP